MTMAAEARARLLAGERVPGTKNGPNMIQTAEALRGVGIPVEREPDPEWSGRGRQRFRYWIPGAPDPRFDEMAEAVRKRGAGRLAGRAAAVDAEIAAEIAAGRTPAEMLASMNGNGTEPEQLSVAELGLGETLTVIRMELRGKRTKRITLRASGGGELVFDSQ